jgi:hypothetical protein
VSTSAARRVAWGAAALLLAVYVATLAPDVTFWDAGEFIAAAHSLGIPHPPGTPLFIILLHAWAGALAALPYAVATNLFSALCTAAAAGLAAWFVVRATDDGWAAFAAALVAGGMSSVWSNGTETEVYAAALALAMASVVAAERAGRTRESRWLLLTGYLVALSVPLHLSALVAAPVVVYLVARPPGTWRSEALRWRAALAIAGVAVVAAAVSRLSPVLACLGMGAVVAAGVLGTRGSGSVGVHRNEPDPNRVRPLAMLVVTAVALSPLLFLLLRARHDPLVNQADPSTLSQLGYVISRRQYDLAPLWPRRAPVWAQLANWFEYADWQTALSLAPSVIPSVARVAATLCCALLAIYGACWHRARDRRTWWAVLLLLLCGSIGVIAYLNLRPGPSFGWGVLPAGIMREARERDYFFVLSFWAWGLWAGMGAVALARRLRWTPAVGVAVALVPIALNWRAVNRRQQPEAGEPREFATALLGASPPRAVLFVAGDNDSYPLWYMQDVLGVRRDVITVTTPLLAASWYAAEFQRRYGLGPDTLVKVRTEPIDRYAAAREIARAARAQGRPVAAALTLPRAERSALGAGWRVAGLVATASAPGTSAEPDAHGGLFVDTAATLHWASQIAGWRRGRVIGESVDPVHEYFGRVLDCPRKILDSARVPAVRASLDTLCNF